MNQSVSIKYKVLRNRDYRLDEGKCKYQYKYFLSLIVFLTLNWIGSSYPKV